MVYFQAFCIGFNSFLVSSVLCLVQQESKTVFIFNHPSPPPHHLKKRKKRKKKKRGNSSTPKSLCLWDLYHPMDFLYIYVIFSSCAHYTILYQFCLVVLALIKLFLCVLSLLQIRSTERLVKVSIFYSLFVFFLFLS